MSALERVLPAFRRCIRKVRRDIETRLEHLRSEPAASLQARARASSLAQVGLLERDAALQRMLSARHASQHIERNRLRSGTGSRTWPRRCVPRLPALIETRVPDRPAWS